MILFQTNSGGDTLKYFLAIICLCSFSLQSFANLEIESENKSWLDLAPSAEIFEDGAVTILIGLADYLQFDVDSLKSSKPDLIKNLERRTCVSWGQINLKPSCLNFLRTNYEDAYQSLLSEFLTFYDAQTPSYDIKLNQAEFSKLDQNFVMRRLNTIVDKNLDHVNPASLLNANVYSALWTVPVNQANCFGTAYAAVTPNARLIYRDYLWGGGNMDFSTKNPRGYLRLEITETLEFGDIIEFEIIGDGHATVYLGTDQDGDDIILTKNGFMPSVVQVMKYEDVFNMYNAFGIRRVNVWRQDMNNTSSYASSGLNAEIQDFKASINTRQNAVQISVDEALAIEMAHGFSSWMNNKGLAK